MTDAPFENEDKLLATLRGYRIMVPIVDILEI